MVPVPEHLFSEGPGMETVCITIKRQDFSFYPSILYLTISKKKLQTQIRISSLLLSHFYGAIFYMCRCVDFSCER